MNDSSLEMQLNNSLICIEPCGESDYLLALIFAYLFAGYLIWTWNHE
jgi:hypothetical protein